MGKFLSVFYFRLNSSQPRYLLHINLPTLRQFWKGFKLHLAHKHKPRLLTHTKMHAHKKQKWPNIEQTNKPLFATHRDELLTPKTQKSDLRAAIWKKKGRQTSSRQPPLWSILSVLEHQGQLHPNCCKFIPFPGVANSLPQVLPIPFSVSLPAASPCCLMSPHLLCTWSSLPTLPSRHIQGTGKAARNSGTKHCWIQGVGKKNLTLGLTWPLLQSVVTLLVDFSATRSIFLLGSCNIPQCSQRRVSGENRQVSVLQWWEQSVFPLSHS